MTDFEPTPEQKRLGPVFNRVCNRADWKSPINAVIPAGDVAIVREAIVFYTATVPTFTPETETLVRVRADGYRRGPAGDH